MTTRHFLGANRGNVIALHLGCRTVRHLALSEAKRVKDLPKCTEVGNSRARNPDNKGRILYDVWPLFTYCISK